MSRPKVFIIILNWNGLGDTLECLESVHNLDYPEFETIVIDNGSAEPCSTVIERDYPKVTVIVNEENVGFAEGNNIGIRYGLNRGADYLWLLNNDTVVAPESLSALVEETEKDSRAGIGGSKICYHSAPEKIWFAGAAIDWLKGISDHTGFGETDRGQYDRVREVERVTGCSMLVRREVIERIGLLDESFFIYAEEVDWCVRARKGGFKCIFVPSSLVYHKVSASASRVGEWKRVFSYYNTRNFLYLVKKSFAFPVREVILLSVILYKLRREKAGIRTALLSLAMPSVRPDPCRTPVLLGIRDFLRSRMGKADYRF